MIRISHHGPHSFAVLSAADGNVATLSLDAQIVELGFAPPPAAAAAAAAVYSFFAISADGELCVWRVPAAALAPKPAAAKGGKKKGAAAANGAARCDVERRRERGRRAAADVRGVVLRPRAAPGLAAEV